VDRYRSIFFLLAPTVNGRLLPFFEAATGRIFVRRPMTGFQRNVTGTLIGQLRTAEREMGDLDLISRSPEVIKCFSLVLNILANNEARNFKLNTYLPYRRTQVIYVLG
jgi:hypothetical protein